MPVQCPTCQWPSSFSECGPVEDPSILLSGTARIAQGAVQILAIRTSAESGRIPDYKSDVPRECYEELSGVLEQVLEDLEYLASEFGELLNDSGSEGIELPTGTYRIVALSSRKTAL
ncbi:MAG TPA: hypothetical protein VMF12_13790 [Xanthobacteraceae bacterium]|nr:hypothetical protein [Xanthobacteraceae bacterium]